MATITVTTGDDTSQPNDGLVSLREAIATANSLDVNDTVDGGAGGDVSLGNSGIDAARFAGDVQDFHIDFVNVFGIERTIERLGAGEVDWLAGIEILAFDTGTFHLDGRNNAPITDDVAVVFGGDAAPLDLDLLLLSRAFELERDARRRIDGDRCAAIPRSRHGSGRLRRRRRPSEPCGRRERRRELRVRSRRRHEHDRPDLTVPPLKDSATGSSSPGGSMPQDRQRVSRPTCEGSRNHG